MKKKIIIGIRAMLCLFGKGRKKRSRARFSVKNQIKLLTRLIFEELKLKVLFRRTLRTAKRENGSHVLFFCYPFPRLIYRYLK